MVAASICGNDIRYYINGEELTIIQFERFRNKFYVSSKRKTKNRKRK